MGNQCCGQSPESKELISDMPSSIIKNSLKSLPNEKREIAPKNYRYENNNNEVDSSNEKIDPHLNQDDHYPNNSIAIPLKTIPNFNNEKALETLKKLGPFKYPDPEFDSIKMQPYQFDNGSIYLGQWKYGMKHGLGKQMWGDGSFYEGDWVNNMACGKGRLIHSDGDYYEGDWKDDKANGIGIYDHMEGAKYEGGWEEDKQHGYGEECWPDGAVYKGKYFLYFI